MRQDFRNFLSVSSDVLHRRSADGSGNAAQALDTGEITLNAELYQSIPFLACTGTNDGFIAIIVPLDAHQIDLQNQSGETIIGDENVRTTTQHEQREVLTFRELECFEDD